DGEGGPRSPFRRRDTPQRARGARPAPRPRRSQLEAEPGAPVARSFPGAPGEVACECLLLGGKAAIARRLLPVLGGEGASAPGEAVEIVAGEQALGDVAAVRIELGSARGSVPDPAA